MSCGRGAQLAPQMNPEPLETLVLSPSFVVENKIEPARSHPLVNFSPSASFLTSVGIGNSRIWTIHHKLAYGPLTPSPSPPPPPLHPQVAGEIRKILGKNIAVHNGLSVGVAWTSVCISHEPPDPPAEHDKEAAEPAAADALQSPSSPSSAKVNDATGPASPGSVGTAAATVITGRGRAGAVKKANTTSPRDRYDPEHANKQPGRRGGRQHRPHGSREREMKKRGRGRKNGTGAGGGSDRGNRKSDGSRGEKTDRKGRRQRQRRGKRRAKSLGSFSPSRGIPKRDQRWGRGRGKNGASTTDRSGGEEVCFPRVAIFVFRTMTLYHTSPKRIPLVERAQITVHALVINDIVTGWMLIFRSKPRQDGYICVVRVGFETMTTIGGPAQPIGCWRR